MKWFRRIAGVVMVLTLVATGFGIWATQPQVAHADGLKDWLIDRVITNIAKRVLGNRDMSDDELRDRVQQGVDKAFRRSDEYFSEEETAQRITDHCWHVYWVANHPDDSAGDWYTEGFIPGEFAANPENPWAQVEVCVRAGYLPSPNTEDIEGSIDAY